MSESRLRNVHEGAVPPGVSGEVSLVKGDYEYWHYCCDGTDDRGWGCGYRTLQTVCSWIRLQHPHPSHSPPPSSESTLPSPPLSSPSQTSADSGNDSDNVISQWDDIITVIDSGDINSSGADVIGDDVSKGSRTGASMAERNSRDLDRSQNCALSSAHHTAPISHQRSDGVDSVVLGSGKETPHSGPTPQSQRIHATSHDSSHPSRRAEVSADQRSGVMHADDVSCVPDVPSLPRIQAALVDMGDKPADFAGSRQWIGSYEVCLCLDFFYHVPCKILHIRQGADLKQHLATLHTHFATIGSPVMMGGDSDASSKGIMGVCMDPGALLVVDPHYSGQRRSGVSLQRAGWVKWVSLQDFHPTSFYNLCLPQLPARASSTPSP